MSGQFFRAAYRQDLRMRVLDAAAHALAAVLVPGAWWLQYLPDAAVVPLWAASAVRDQFLPDDHWLLAVHRHLHLRCLYCLPWQLVLYVLLAVALAQPWLMAHVAVHVAIDACTHGKEWQ